MPLSHSTPDKLAQLHFTEPWNNATTWVSVERNTAVHNGTANEILIQGLQGLLALTLIVQAGSHYVAQAGSHYIAQAHPQHLILLLLPQFLKCCNT